MRALLHVQPCNLSCAGFLLGRQEGTPNGALLVDEFDVFLEQIVDELDHIDPIGLGVCGPIGLDDLIEVNRGLEDRARAEELAAHTVGEVDLGGHVVVTDMVVGHSIHGSIRSLDLARSSIFQRRSCVVSAYREFLRPPGQHFQFAMHERSNDC
jgi:hypothetical protein